MNRTVAVGAVAAVALVGLGALIITGRQGAAPAAPVAAPGSAQRPTELLLPARTKGAEQAPIVIYEVSDFQCPYCRQFWAETLPALEQEYIETGKARLTFINFPIPELHHNAQAAHEVAMCGAEQDKFWAFHDLLYAHQATWAGLADPKTYFLGLADSARADRAAFETCLATGRMRQLVGAEAAASWQAGVRSTPSFIVQGALLAGAAPIKEWRPILDSIYRARTEEHSGAPKP